MTTCPPMSIWVVLPPQAGAGRTASAHQTLAIPPSVAIVEHIPVADFRRKKGGPEGQPLAYLFQAVEVRPESLTLSPFEPKEQFSLGAAYAKPKIAPGPRTHGPVSIHVEPQRGLVDRSGRPPGGELEPQISIAPEPRIQTEAWRSEALKPSDPGAGKPAALFFEAQADGSAGMRRPKQALRELVLPSPRPWQSLEILWQSFGGFHLAMPPAEAVAGTTVQATAPVELWDFAAEMNVLGKRFFQESQDILVVHEPSLEGARARLLSVLPAAIRTALSPGFEEAFSGSKPVVEGHEIFTTTVPEELPRAQSVPPPVPAVALTEGLTIWIGVINSYMHRSLCAPRLREGGRVVHTLRLAPSMQVNEECEISAA